MKKLFYYVLIFFIIVVVISMVIVIEKKVNHPKAEDELSKKLTALNNIDKKIDYFNYDYLDRYLSYKENNPNLTDEDIITRVNLNLDYPYYENIKQSNQLNKNTILVNKYIYLPNDYIPDNLAEINNEYAIDNKQLVYEAKEKFEEMCDDAKANGYTIRAISAYRDYEYQKNLYDKYLSTDTKENVDTYSARPGHSEHQTGLVVDVDNSTTNFENFESTEEYKWMRENSYKYGFILRYPKGKEDITGYSYESWHYRYVGKTIAKYIYENNITFDEYYVKYIDN